MLKKWKEEENKFLIDNYKTYGPKYCAEILKRSKQSVHNRSRALGLSCLWSEQEIDILKEFYYDNGGVWCANKLKRSLLQIRYKACALGLRTKYIKNEHYFVNKIDTKTVLAFCHKHGVCEHRIKRRGIYCRLCNNTKTENIRIKAKINFKKYRKNPINRLACNLRCLIGNSLTRISKNNNRQTKGCFRNLDYTPLQLYNYLENTRKLQENKCPHCNISYDKCKISIDHVIPLITAKTEQQIINLFDLKNLNLMCKNCNSSKNDNNFQEWYGENNILTNCVSIQ